MAEERRALPPEQKDAILRGHLLDGVTCATSTASIRRSSTARRNEKTGARYHASGSPQPVFTGGVQRSGRLAEFVLLEASRKPVVMPTQRL